MKKDVMDGIIRSRGFMRQAENVQELEVAYYAAKGYIAGCNDSGTLDHAQWADEWKNLKILHEKLKDILEGK